MPLLTDYRPETLDQVIGHVEVVKSIRKALSKGNSSRAWLFTGPSGVGKTTLARIVARELGAVGAGIVEMNIAHLRGIDAVKEMVYGAQFKTPGSKVTVFILDEVQQMTNEAQNVLLKSLEDPPSHVYFMLCTTRPTKIIPAIRTRTVEYTLRGLKDDELADVLLVAAKGERVEPDPELVVAIVERSLGSPRLALNLLAKSIGLSLEEALPLIDSVVQDWDIGGPVDQARELVEKLLSPTDRSWKKLAQFLDKRVLGPLNVDDFKLAWIGVMGQKLLWTPVPWLPEAIQKVEASLIGANTKAGLTSLVYQVWQMAEKSGTTQQGRGAVKSSTILS